MVSGVISSVINAKYAKRLTLFVVSAVIVMSGVLLYFVARDGESFVYLMGHYPAPWGNELRAGVFEALTAFLFSLILLLSLLGGMRQIDLDVQRKKRNLYFIMVDLLLASLLALIYTNDMFNAYVFIELNTIAACGLMMSKQTGRTLLAGTKYMIMSLIGSGLILIGISFLYDITGHLLMPNINEALEAIRVNGEYPEILVIIIGLFTVGLAMKSGLFPFHAWMPDAYGSTTAASSALLSSLVSKAYIFLLVKIIYRVFGFGITQDHRIMNLLYVFALIAMILGSVRAIAEQNLKRMIAYSSVAQIGYIYMGIGLDRTIGIYAAIFHIFSHSASKALLFISANGLIQASEGNEQIASQKGAGYRNVIAGIGFAVGSLSLVGIPLFAGFISKFYFAQACLLTANKRLPTLIVLGISTLLNAMYFLRTVVMIYQLKIKENAHGEEQIETEKESSQKSYDVVEKEGVFKNDAWFSVSTIAFVVLNFVLGIFAQPIMNLIKEGIQMFS